MTYGELWRTPEFEDTDLTAYFDEVYADSYVNKGYGYYKADLGEMWPAYAAPAHDARCRETEAPMLIMQGMLDPITTYELALPLEAHYTAPGRPSWRSPRPGTRCPPTRRWRTAPTAALR